MKDVNKIIQGLRTEMKSFHLDRKNVHSNPIIQFERWMENAIDAKVLEPNAMTLATSGKKNQPDARIVLLRGVDKKGFSFFTNYRSAKGKEMAENKKVCLNFFWTDLSRQVRIMGVVEKISPKVSEEYFQSRPRDSRISAWASNQSEQIENRAALEKKFDELEKKFSSGNIPRPPHWGGYIVKPLSIEFWQGRENRLHDRIFYEKGKSGKWKISMLSP